MPTLTEADLKLLFLDARPHSFWLEKPVIAINTATYWHALRSNDIHDAVDGFGPLLTHLDLKKD